MYDPAGVNYDPILTNFSVGFQAPELIYSQVSPTVPVATQGGKYRVFDRSGWLIYNDRREPGAEAHEIQGGKWSEDTYWCVEHAIAAPVYDEELQNLGVDRANPANAALFAGIEPLLDATEATTRAIELRLETELATLLRATGTYAGGHSTTLSGTSQWSDYSGTSDPISVVEAAIRTVYSKIYQVPNVMIIPWYVWSFLRNHPKIVDRIKYTAITAEDAFLQLTGFKGKLLIPESVYNTADNVDATESVSEVWGKDVILARVDTTPQMKTKTLVKTFAQPYPSGQVRETDQWYEKNRRTTKVRTSMKYQLKIVSNVAGYVIKAAAA